MSTSPSRLGYRPALDGVRGVSIVMVLLFHLSRPRTSGGFIGVDVFFVLSGFLITALLAEEWQRTGRINFRGFYRRRAQRLLPALFAVLASVVGFAFILLGRPRAYEVGRQAVAALLYVMNWALAFGRLPHGPFAHTWSLSIEEQFYTVWPLALWVLWRSGMSRGAVLAVVLVLATASAAFRSIHWSLCGDDRRVFFGTDARLDALMVGCAAGLLFCWDQVPRSRWGDVGLKFLASMGAIVIALLAAFPVSRGAFHTWGFAAIHVGVASLLLALVSPTPFLLGRGLEVRPLVWVGQISYGLYLWHHPVYWLFDGLRVCGSWWTDVARMAASFAVATLSFYGLERHFLRSRRMLKPV